MDLSGDPYDMDFGLNLNNKLDFFNQKIMSEPDSSKSVYWRP